MSFFDILESNHNGNINDDEKQQYERLKSKQIKSYSLLNDKTTREELALDKSLLSRKYQDYLKEIRTPRTCITCHEQYIPEDNFRMRSCYSHVYEYTDMYTGRFQCCGGSLHSLGCVSAIHFSRLSQKRETFKDPLNSKIKIPAELIDHGLVLFEPLLLESKKIEEQFYSMTCFAITPI